MAPTSDSFSTPFVNPFAAPVLTQDEEDQEQTAAPVAAAPGAAFGLVFQAPDVETRAPRRERPTPAEESDDEQDAASDQAEEPNERRSRKRDGERSSRRRRDDNGSDDASDDASAATADEEAADSADGHDDDDDTDPERTPRRRRRGGRGRRSRGGNDEVSNDSDSDSSDASDDDDDAADSDDTHDNDESHEESSSRKRTRRRRRSGSGSADSDDPNTVTKVREPRRAKDEVTSIKGSTRLEAKKQRRREGRELGRRRTVITEAEFLARRESVERQMVVRERDGRTQIAVLEDGVLAEHYVSRQEQAASMAGNVYLGRVQNVLPSMEAAFVDIGRGRNAVLYAGEVNWDAAGLDNQPKRIEHALKAGESVLVQVTKDPIGHKGARLTSQISLPGRFLVYVPGNSMTGISRKLPDTERSRLKKILKEIVPADAGVIVRTAAEGASEAELRADVERLAKLWEKIQKKAETGNAPSLLHGEPDLTVRVIRDVFNEDFSKMIVSGDHAWNEVHSYISEVAPDLVERLEKYEGKPDLFSVHRIDEQLAKAMDRKVWLPSGGSLVIDRTEAMTVIDVNTGKFVGSGGNLEETVTKNNIEAAEEIVRQLRLRDIGGIIVVDFIDMVLESNRDLVVRRLLECLGRDRTKHQVAEVTSLGLVQMTRKRVGSGLVEVFSEPCAACHGRGIIIHDHPVENRDINGNDTSRKGRGRKNRGESNQQSPQTAAEKQAEKDNGFAQIAAAAHAAAVSAGDKSDKVHDADEVEASVVDVRETESGAEVTLAVEPAHVEQAEPKRERRSRKSGRIVPKAARAHLADSDVEPADVATAEVVPVKEEEKSSRSTVIQAPVQAPVATKPKRRRAATSAGAVTTAGQATVMTVDADAASNGVAPTDSPDSAGGSRVISSASSDAAPKRGGRRAASSAGAPVSLQPVDLGSMDVDHTPLTKVAGEAASTSDSVKTTTETTQAKPVTRRKRARVVADAGAPGAVAPKKLDDEQA